MNHHKKLVNYIDCLISDKAKCNGDVYSLSISDLDDDELGQLSALKLEDNDRDVSECVNGLDFTIDNDYTCALLKMLQHDTADNREDFARVVTKNTIAYFSVSLQELIDERCNDYLHERQNSNGYYANLDRDNGDIVWRRLA